MTRYVTPTGFVRRPASAWSRPAAKLPRVVVETHRPLNVTCYAFYIFVFSLPFEAMGPDLGTGFGSLVRLAGYAFVGLALLDPKLYVKRPPKAFWYFAAYLCVYMLLGSMLEEPTFTRPMMSRFMTLTQMLVLSWLSYNMLQYAEICRNTFVIFGIACICLALSLALGITSTDAGTSDNRAKQARGGRLVATEQNPNTTANILTLGLLSLLGVAYSQQGTSATLRRLAWLGLGVLASVIVLTGSRGAVVAVMVGLLPFLLKSKGVAAWLRAKMAGLRLKAGLTVVVALVLFVGVSYYYEPVRKRWEQTFIEGSLAQREKIFPAAWEMFLERPLTGWGPVNHYYELGARLGYPTKDPHNFYLWVLTEVGILGAAPFFLGLWYCGRAAWRARASIHGVLPLALFLSLLAMNMKGTWHSRKLFWIVLAYTLVSGSVVILPRPKLRNTDRFPRKLAPGQFAEGPLDYE